MYTDEMQLQYAKLNEKESVKILAIETSCDETSVAIVENGRKILSNIVASQIDIHQRFGGVVPEVASRNHIASISNVYQQALAKAKLTEQDIDAIAVTYGAGLVGALLVGINFAKGLSFSLGKPLIAVSHIQGHIAANYLTHESLQPPFVCLMVSGGHTAIMSITDYNRHELYGTTVDDAVGEAFDKTARVLGLGYPGGPAVDRQAKTGQANIGFVHQGAKMQLSNDFSFSGIKTAVINYVHKQQQNGEELNIPDICASFQKVVVDELVTKAFRCLKEKQSKKLVVAGGVAANSFLKERLQKECKTHQIELFMPVLNLCTDNAAMIASAAYYHLRNGENLADLSLTAKPTIPL